MWCNEINWGDEKEVYWSIARTNIQNLNTSWFTMLNSFQFVQESYQVYLPPCFDESGYNHFELRNYERGYQLKDGNTIVFEKGERAPQYDKVIDWLRNLLGTNN